MYLLATKIASTVSILIHLHPTPSIFWYILWMYSSKNFFLWNHWRVTCLEAPLPLNTWVNFLQPGTFFGMTTGQPLESPPPHPQELSYVSPVAVRMFFIAKDSSLESHCAFSFYVSLVFNLEQFSVQVCLMFAHYWVQVLHRGSAVTEILLHVSPCLTVWECSLHHLLK